MIRSATLLRTVIVTAMLAWTAAAHAQLKPIRPEDMRYGVEQYAHQLSPDGKLIVFQQADRSPSNPTAPSHLWVHDIAAGTTKQVTVGSGESDPRWLDAGTIAFTANRDTRVAWWKTSLGGGDPVKVFPEFDVPPSALWSADGKRVVWTELVPRADQREWDDRVRRRDDAYYAEQRLEFTHLFTYDPATRTKRQLTSGRHHQSQLAMSPDGSRVAYVSNREGIGPTEAHYRENFDIYVMSLDSGTERRLTQQPGADNAPAWSPDGKWIAYRSTENRNYYANEFDATVIPADGGVPHALTKDFDYSVSNVTWSPDGASLYFGVLEGLATKYYKIPARGGPREAIDLGDMIVPNTISRTRDGSRWLVRGATRTESNVILLTEADGRNARPILAEHVMWAGFAKGRTEFIQWMGQGGLAIDGILTYPIGYEPGKKYPLLLWIHGGPFDRFDGGFDANRHIWASRGYVLLQPNPRGSSGKSLAFAMANKRDWGGKDLDDVLRGVDRVIAMGVADPERMGIFGYSYGGSMAYRAITKTHRFKAALGQAGTADYRGYIAETDIPYWLEQEFGLPINNPLYDRLSPINEADKIKTPLLIMHGENDPRMPISQSQAFYRLLKMQGKTVEFIRFPREGHGFREPLHFVYWHAEMERWFARYLLNPAQP